MARNHHPGSPISIKSKAIILVPHIDMVWFQRNDCFWSFEFNWVSWISSQDSLLSLDKYQSFGNYMSSGSECTEVNRKKSKQHTISHEVYNCRIKEPLWLNPEEEIHISTRITQLHVLKWDRKRMHNENMENWKHWEMLKWSKGRTTVWFHLAIL